MYILITESEYNSHSYLPGMMSNTEDEFINGVDCKHGEISVNNLNSIENQLSVGSFTSGTGVLLPESVRKKNQ